LKKQKIKCYGEKAPVFDVLRGNFPNVKQAKRLPFWRSVGKNSVNVYAITDTVLVDIAVFGGVCLAGIRAGVPWVRPDGKSVPERAVVFVDGIEQVESGKPIGAGEHPGHSIQERVLEAYFDWRNEDVVLVPVFLVDVKAIAFRVIQDSLTGLDRFFAENVSKSFLKNESKEKR